MIKIVYVHIGTEKKEYLNMLKISVASVRKHMPNIEIDILTDNETGLFLKKCEFLSGGNTVIMCVEVPKELTTVEKSRYLKTNLRNFVSGDFLYIDSDTVVCCDLSQTEAKHSVSLVLDENRLLNEQDDGGDFIRERALMRGYDLSSYYNYYNSGVMLIKDDETAKLFFNKWHEEWDKTRKPGMHQDQFSLNWINKNMDIIAELDGSFNCQATASYKGIEYLRNAKILHYFSLQNAGIYKLNDIKILSDELTSEFIDSIIDHPEKAFRKFHMFADDSVEYELINTSHFHFIERIYTRHKKLFSFFEKIYKVFRKKQK